MNRLLEEILELLDIPPSYYKKAEDRYLSLGRWFHRPESSVRDHKPDVYVQGSFRYGTVIRPLLRNEEYDLDLVCQLALSKGQMSPMALKELVGGEVKSYADGHGFKDAAEEKRRCWRLNYQDDVSFHMDILPSIPDDDQFKALLVSQGITKEFADEAVAITDKTYSNYEQVSDDWPRSNPRGFAGWFESQMKAVAQTRRAMLVANQAYASIDDVPPYEWKTPLQRSIQILKRHRDVMFQTDPDQKPISMIITTLSAHAYGGEIELHAALTNIVDRMPQFVRETHPRVPNPVNPAEDFADKWAEDSALEKNFWDWHTQVKADLDNLCKPLNEDQVQRSLRGKFDVDLSSDRAKQIATLSGGVVAAIPSKAPTVIHSAPKPWHGDA
jgi:hypothetical protein